MDVSNVKAGVEEVTELGGEMRTNYLLVNSSLKIRDHRIFSYIIVTSFSRSGEPLTE